MSEFQSVKQVLDFVGYGVMGIIGLFGAYQRMRTVTSTGPFLHLPFGKRTEAKGIPLERLENVEREVMALRKRQTVMHEESAVQQGTILRQQSAIFDLLVHQRRAVDKILAKMGGIE